MEGEGMATILVFIGVLVLLLVLVIAWQFIKERRSVYTYAYQKK